MGAILSQIEDALVRNERVELRDIFTLETRIQKPRISRNPKTQEKVEVSEKKSIKFKMYYDENLSYVKKIILVSRH